jgi:CheY-like chemotaxis protein
MKDGDGLELIRRLRADGHQMPVIALTGGDPRSPQSTSANVASQAGANRVLMKPVTKALLLDTIAELIPFQTQTSDKRLFDDGCHPGSQ